jgi:hypothetical protein
VTDWVKPDTIDCWNCGTTNPYDRDFCTKCASDLHFPPLDKMPPRDEPIVQYSMAPFDFARPPETRPLTEPPSYREHITEVMTRSHELARQNKQRGDRYALGAILLAFASSAVGFLTAALDAALVGIAAGTVAAAAGAVAAWTRRGQFDAIAGANRQLSRGLERELRLYDGRVGPYEPQPGEDPAIAQSRAFKIFVDRCEQLSTDAEAAVTASGGESP